MDVLLESVPVQRQRLPKGPLLVFVEESHAEVVVLQSNGGSVDDVVYPTLMPFGYSLFSMHSVSMNMCSVYIYYIYCYLAYLSCC